MLEFALELLLKSHDRICRETVGLFPWLFLHTHVRCHNHLVKAPKNRNGGGDAQTQQSLISRCIFLLSMLMPLDSSQYSKENLSYFALLDMFSLPIISLDNSLMRDRVYHTLQMPSMEKCDLCAKFHSLFIEYNHKTITNYKPVFYF